MAYQDSSEPAASGNALATANTTLTKPARSDDPFEKLVRWSDPRKTLNIADDLDDDKLNEIGAKCKKGYDIDVTSRSDWMDRSKDAMKLAMQLAEKKTTPWEGASNVIYPLMTMAAVEFAARAYPAIIAGRSVVKGVVCGDDTGTPKMGQDGTPLVQMTQAGPQPVWASAPGEKTARSNRIGEHMSWQLLTEQPEWEQEEDKMLHILPVVGSVFRKSFFDPQWSRNMSLMVRAEKLVINYWAKSLELAPRLSEEIQLYPYEIEERIRGELFTEQPYQSTSSSGDEDDPRDFIEQHRRLDLDGDGYEEPYIVTWHKDTNKVARIVARYDPEGIHILRRDRKILKIDPIHYYTQFEFLPNMEGGIYGMGFGQLLSPINESINTAINMLFDSGTRQVHGGGFVGRGLSMHTGSVKFKMGEYKIVNAPGGKIRDAIVQMEIPQPSGVLFSLLGMLIDAGKDVARIKDILMGEAKAGTMQPTTLLALIEQGLKVFTGIYKRTFRAHKSEFEKLFRLNRIYGQENSQYKVGSDWKSISLDDYRKGGGVEPVSDPNMVSDMQRLGRAQFLQGYQNDPLCDPLFIRRTIFEAANLENIDKILVKELPKPPPDPKVLESAAKLEHDEKELEFKCRLMKAQEIQTLTAAIKNMADVDKIISDDQRGWVTQQWDILRHLAEGVAQIGPGGQRQIAGPASGGDELDGMVPIPLSPDGGGPPIAGPDGQPLSMNLPGMTPPAGGQPPGGMV